jgi:hypothetical protein
MATGGVATTGQDVRATQLTVEEMAAAVEAAHRTLPKCSQLWRDRSAAIICLASRALPLCLVCS